MNSPFYLTIDDGPSEYMDEKISILEQRNIPATWFCLGKNIEKYPDMVIRAIKRGDIIANHSYSHIYFSGSDLELCREEIALTEKLINDIYQAAGVPRPAKLFRFPYGEPGNFHNGRPSVKTESLKHKQNLQKILLGLGYQTGPFSSIEYHGNYTNHSNDRDWLWSYDIQEWAIGNKGGYELSLETVRDNLKNYLEGYDSKLGQIILTHDHEKTHRLFLGLVDEIAQHNVVWHLLTPIE